MFPEITISPLKEFPGISSKEPLTIARKKFQDTIRIILTGHANLDSVMRAISQVVDLAHRARVINLYLFHHDLDQTDADIDAKLKTAKTILAQHNSQAQVIAPREKQPFKI